MRIPLATLKRQSTNVWLYQGLSALPAGAEKARTFSSVGEAEGYFSFWKTDAAAMTALRFALYRCESSASIFSQSDAQVLRLLASRVVSGALLLKESDAASAQARLPDAGAGADVAAAFRVALYRCEQDASALALSDLEVLQSLADKLNSGALVLTAQGLTSTAGGWPTVRADASAAGADVAVSSTVVNLNALPDIVPVLPLLPLLEELQIEGAEVLPEITQSLEQIDLTLGTIDLAGISLEPTPSKVAQINTAMTDASQAVTKTIDDL
jgi:hypothetical protein